MTFEFNGDTFSTVIALMVTFMRETSKREDPEALQVMVDIARLNTAIKTQLGFDALERFAF